MARENKANVRAAEGFCQPSYSIAIGRKRPNMGVIVRIGRLDV